MYLKLKNIYIVVCLENKDKSARVSMLWGHNYYFYLLYVYI